MKKISAKVKRQKIYYDKESDVLWLLVKSGPEYEYKELTPNVSVELGKNGELLGVEILNASKILKPVLGKQNIQTSL